MRIQGHLRTDDTGKCSGRKIYLCWLPAAASQKTAWVDKFFGNLKTISRDDNLVPVSAERPAMEAGTATATEQQACRDGVTDFVFIATVQQIEKHRALVIKERNSDLKWVLDLQSVHDASTPRIWLVPLEKMNLSWFEFPPRTSPEKFLNDYEWHFPMPSLIAKHEKSGSIYKVRGIETKSEETQEDLDQTLDGLLAHGANPCEICEQ